ncbi:unnamed protein product [Symbiodinium sp. KB8]|nr:unnamed protein product [Symbiodinium sp. KB8]
MPSAGPIEFRQGRHGLGLGLGLGLVFLGAGISWSRSPCFACAPRGNAGPFPSVSVQVVTYNRPSLLLEALLQIEAQDYPTPLEVLILDDSDTSSEKDVLRFAANSRHDIQYRFLSERLTIGEKRNLAAESTSAEFICTWDDDDIYTVDRVRLQAEFLSGNRRCNCVAIERRFFYWLNEDVLRGCEDVQFLPLENTLCFRRRWFEAGRRFAAGSLNEGLGLLRGPTGVKHPGRLGILPISAEELPFLYIKHSGSMTGTGKEPYAKQGAEISLLPLVRACHLGRFPDLPSRTNHSRILRAVRELLRTLPRSGKLSFSLTSEIDPSAFRKITGGLISGDLDDLRATGDAIKAARYLEALTGVRPQDESLQGLLDGIGELQAALVTG